MNNYAPKLILSPVDFSDPSAEALRVAGVIARERNGVRYPFSVGGLSVLTPGFYP